MISASACSALGNAIGEPVLKASHSLVAEALGYSSKVAFIHATRPLSHGHGTSHQRTVVRGGYRCVTRIESADRVTGSHATAHVASRT